jgi:hypothetical protein
MKIVTRIGLLFSFSALMAFATATHARAEEYYTYRDPHGKLVISNKTPPPGSHVLKKQVLPETVGEQAPQPPQAADSQPNGRPESSPEPKKSQY